MRRPAFALAAFAAAALALAPALADARPGGGSSSGSRGSRTYSAPPSTSTAPNQPRQFDRTATEPSRGGVATNPAAQRPPIGQPNPAGNFLTRSPFMAGMLGGLIGVGLGGMLFGHGLFSGFTGFGSILGFLLQMALIGGLVWLAVGFFRRRQSQQPAMAGMSGGLPGGGMPRGMAREMDPGAQGRGISGGGAAGAAAGAAITLAPTEFAAFEQLLKDVNAAWSRQDMGTLRRIATPEMAQYFENDLADLAARNWRNETRDVALEQGDLSEAWREASRDYATVAMRFSLIDVTRNLTDNTVVEGDPQRRTQATELWTFVRPQGGTWQVSAIQQAA